MTWIVEHAADIINRFAVGPDGKTAYERIKGKKYRGEVVEFGRMVMYRIPRKSEGGVHGRALGPRCVAGKKRLV